MTYKASAIQKIHSFSMLSRSAVDGVGSPGDVGGLIGHQERDQEGDFLRARNPWNRAPPWRHPGQTQLLHRDLKHRRVDRAWAYRIAPDIVSRALEGNCPANCGHAALARRVRGPASATQRGGGSQIDDCSAARALEMGNSILAQQEDAAQVDGKRTVENVLGDV